MTEDAQIEQLLREGRSFDFICKTLNVPEMLVRDIAIVRLGRWVISADRRGRPELRKYIVTIRHVNGIWSDFGVIERARKDYDDGKVELCQARDGNNIILYAIPRGTRIKRPFRYFEWNRQ